MPSPFTHDTPSQRVVFAPGAVSQIGEEAARLKFERALVIATPGSGERLGNRIVEELGARAAGLHAQAVIHVPVAVAAASGMNALAHCVEALWVEGRTPVTDAVAVEGVRRFTDNLPRAVRDGR